MPSTISTRRKIVASMSGTSRILSASTVSAPIPGQPNTVSMMMTPVMTLTVSSPMVVTIGMDAFLSAWIEATFESGMPRPGRR